MKPFEWNNEAYENLVIPPEQKSLLTTLVEAHNSSPASKFDDFVEGKGLGLVVNLFGNPGTGMSNRIHFGILTNLVWQGRV